MDLRPLEDEYDEDEPYDEEDMEDPDAPPQQEEVHDVDLAAAASARLRSIAYWMERSSR